MAEEIRICISDGRAKGVWGRFFRGLIMAVFPISVGIVTDSAAMQWMGFVITVLIGIAAAVNISEKYIDLSIPEARKRLDEMERAS